jgi:hypothetical protein
MHDWSLPLVLAAVAFLVALLWRVRPAMGGRRRGTRAALQQAQERIESAPDDAARAQALCDAGDIVAAAVGGGAGAAAFYLRALRCDPASPGIVRRVAEGLERRPRTLEATLWRHLAATPWSGPTGASVRAALECLRDVYDGRLRSTFRARAVANAIKVLPE